jgi:protein-tyrosine phosphatase
MAEALLRHRLVEAGVEATVSSAGLLTGGRPATGHGVAAMASRGLDLKGHRSRQLAIPLVQRADLIIGMAREHVREVAVTDPPALARTFTLKELVRAAEAKGARGADESFDEWLARLAVGRRRDQLVGVGHDRAFDIADPVGRGRADYEATADEIDGLLARLVELAWPALDIDEGQERSA